MNLLVTHAEQISNNTSWLDHDPESIYLFVYSVQSAKCRSQRYICTQSHFQLRMA